MVDLEHDRGCLLAAVLAREVVPLEHFEADAFGQRFAWHFSSYVVVGILFGS
jgi:hypothetical protein